MLCAEVDILKHGDTSCWEDSRLNFSARTEVYSVLIDVIQGTYSSHKNEWTKVHLKLGSLGWLNKVEYSGQQQAP